ncbi:MAG: hypothetical protein ACFFAY_14185 [Promethearchaeota archaeon]
MSKIDTSLASLSGCCATTTPPHPSEFKKMAETQIIRIKDLPSRDLREQVKVFLQGEEVSVEDESGQRFGVIIQRNKLMFRSDDGDTNSS